MRLALLFLFLVILISGCAVARTAGSVAGTAAKTTVKAGGAVVDGAVDAVDSDKEEKNRR